MIAKLYALMAKQPDLYDGIFAPEILDLVEEAGMIPPWSKKVWQRDIEIYIEPNANKWEDE